MSVTLEDRPLHPLPWQNLQRLARYCMIHYISRKAHGSPSSAPQRLLLRANLLPPFTKLTFGDEHESIFCSVCAIMDVLVNRSTYSSWKSFDCLLPPQCHDIFNRFPLLTSISLRPPKGTISTFSQPPNMFFSAPELIDVG